ncbi:MAG: hypothetical protein ACREJ3_03910 [Polyangiaceae bacterium]
MFDPLAASTKQALAELEDEGVRRTLLRVARGRCASDSDAEDLVANALVRICDPERDPWDPARGPFVRHMAYVMRDMAIDRARSWDARTIVTDSVLAHDEDIEDPASLADDALDAHRARARLHRLGVALRARLADDAHAVAVFDCACRGVEEPAAQADEIGCSVKDVYEARRRLKYHAAAILAEERDVEARSKKEAREAAAVQAIEKESA